MITAVALDPGRTTGYALAYRDDNHFYIAYDQARMNHQEFWNFLAGARANFLICENFEYRRNQSDADLYPCELIGVYHLWHQMFGLGEPYMQDPWVQGSKKAYYSDKRLKDLELYHARPEHGRSAVKHLLYWFQFGPGFKFHVKGQQAELVEESWIKKIMGI